MSGRGKPVVNPHEMSFDKKAVRTSVSHAVKSLSQGSIESQSANTTSLVLKHPRVHSAKTIGVFMSMDGEIQTLPLIQQLITMGKTVYLPRCSQLEPGEFQRWPKQKSLLRFHKMDSFQDVISLKPQGKFQIREPTSGEDAMESEEGIDMLIMPGVGFSEDCYRTGYGGGFYDDYIKRHVEKFNKRPYLLGIGLEQQFIQEIPVEPHDEQLNNVILNDRIYNADK